MPARSGGTSASLAVQRGFSPRPRRFAQHDHRDSRGRRRTGAACSLPTPIGCTRYRGPQLEERDFGFESVRFGDSKRSYQCSAGTFKRLKCEWRPPRPARAGTEAQGRIHTSTVTVAVLPEAEVDIAIKPEEPGHRCRASGLRPGREHDRLRGADPLQTHRDDRALRRPAVAAEEQSPRADRPALAAVGAAGRRRERHALPKACRYRRAQRTHPHNFPQNRVSDRGSGSRSTICRPSSRRLDPIIEPLMALIWKKN